MNKPTPKTYRTIN